MLTRVQKKKFTSAKRLDKYYEYIICINIWPQTPIIINIINQRIRTIFGTLLTLHACTQVYVTTRGKRVNLGLGTSSYTKTCTIRRFSNCVPLFVKTTTLKRKHDRTPQTVWSVKRIRYLLMYWITFLKTVSDLSLCVLKIHPCDTSLPVKPTCVRIVKQTLQDMLRVRVLYLRAFA